MGVRQWGEGAKQRVWGTPLLSSQLAWCFSWCIHLLWVIQLCGARLPISAQLCREPEPLTSSRDHWPLAWWCSCSLSTFNEPGPLLPALFLPWLNSLGLIHRLYGEVFLNSSTINISGWIIICFGGYYGLNSVPPKIYVKFQPPVPENMTFFWKLFHFRCN